MPELPEVETTRRGIAPAIENNTVQSVTIRNGSLRWPVDSNLPDLLKGLKILSVKRRAKYLLLATEKGHLIIHLGMSGNLKILTHNAPLQKHDHVDIVFNNNILLRYHDPRRFGSILWTDKPVNQFKLLVHLAPEPLSSDFSSEWLYPKLQKRKTAIKVVLMDNKYVVGVGNIYANESLFLSNISPLKPANTLSLKETELLIKNIKIILEKAIEQGGTTLKDFSSPDGKPGYFVQQLSVYGQDNKPCPTCKTSIVKVTQAQRASFYCPSCQH